MTDIPVGKGPQFIYGDFLSDRIYVANVGDNSASVINKTDNRHLYDIPVGHDPVYIFGDKSHIDTIYVANSGGQDISVGSDMPFITGGGISLINIKTDKVVAGVTFHKSPFIGGSVICNTNSRGFRGSDESPYLCVFWYKLHC